MSDHGAQLTVVFQPTLSTFPVGGNLSTRRNATIRLSVERWQTLFRNWRVRFSARTNTVIYCLFGMVQTFARRVILYLLLRVLISVVCFIFCSLAQETWVFSIQKLVMIGLCFCYLGKVWLRAVSTCDNFFSGKETDRNVSLCFEFLVRIKGFNKRNSPIRYDPEKNYPEW